MDAWCRGRDWPQAVGWHRSGSASAVPFCRREAVAVRGGRSATRPCRTTLRTSVQRRAWLALRFVRATMSECQCVRPEACTNPQWMWRLISFGSSSMARCRGATVVHGGREVPCRVGRNGGVGGGVGGGRRVRPRCSRSDRSVGVGGSAGSDQPPVAAGRSADEGAASDSARARPGAALSVCSSGGSQPPAAVSHHRRARPSERREPRWRRPSRSPGR